MTNVHKIFVTEEKIRLFEQKLQHRFDDAKTIEGTHGYHHFSPTRYGEISVAIVSGPSNLPKKTVQVLSPKFEPLPFDCIALSDYVAICKDKNWFLGIVTERVDNSQSFQVSLLLPSGPT